MAVKLFGLVAVAFLLFYVFTAPDSAGDSTRQMGGMLKDGGTSMVEYTDNLFTGD